MRTSSIAQPRTIRLAEVDVPGRPSGELDAAVERREDRLGWPGRAARTAPRSSRAGVSLAAPRAVVGRRRQPDRRDLAAEERRLLAVAERHAEIDELGEPAGPGRWPPELGGDPDICRPDERRGRRARREARPISSRGLAVPASASSETTALTLVAQRRGRGEPLGAEAAERAAVRREEDERVLRLRPAGDRAEPAVAARELDQGRRAGGVVVRARARRRCCRGGRGRGSRRGSRPGRR